MSAIYDSSGNILIQSSGGTLQIGDSSLNLTIVTTPGEGVVKDSSLGNQFYWDSGFLNVIDSSGIDPDVSRIYVDGSLATRDAEIALKANLTYVDGSLNAKADLSQGIQVIANGQYPVYFNSLDDLATYLTSIASSAEGVVITMPPGNFTTTNPITFPSGLKITLRGAGSGYILTFSAGAIFNDWTDISRVRITGDCTFNNAIFLKDSLLTGNIMHTVSDFNVTKCGITGDYTNSGSGKIVALNLELTGKATLAGTGDQMLINVQVTANDASAAVYSAGQLIASNLVVLNTGGGEDINCDNGATSPPNMLNSIYCFSGTITSGTAATVIGSVYTASPLSGSAIARLNTV